MTTFLVLLVAYTLSQFYRAFLAIVAGDLSRDLGLNAADLGSASAVWFAAFALAQFPVGTALDRFGPRRTIAGFMTLAVLGAAWLALARHRVDCLGAMALIGVGCSPILMGSLYLFGRMYPPGRFAMLSSLVIGLGSAGNLLGATPLALAVEAFGWRSTMGAIAVITAASVALTVTALQDPPLVPAAKHGSVLGGLKEIAAMRALWLLLPLSFLSYAVVIATRSLWIAPFFADVHGFDATQRGNAALVMAAAMSVGALAYGPIERTLGDPKRTTLLGSFATGACYVVLGLAGHRSAGAALVLVGLIGAAGMTYGILMAHARLFFPAHILGRGVTFMNFLFIGGAGLVQWLSGLLIETGRAGGIPPDQIFAQLHLAFGMGLILTTAIYLGAPARPRPLEP